MKPAPASIHFEISGSNENAHGAVGIFSVPVAGIKRRIYRLPPSSADTGLLPLLFGWVSRRRASPALC